MSTISEMLVNIGGTTYSMMSDDDYLAHAEDGFEPEMVRLFRTLASDSDVILDVGANIGCTALLFGGLARTVHAFEPAPSTFAFLKQNIERSGLKNVVAHNVGFGAEPGQYTITFSPSNRSGGFVSNHTRVSAGHIIEQINILQLDEVIDSLDPGRIDFIKIDVEGFEGHVLRGAKRTLATFEPTVVMELNHWCLNVFQRTSIPTFLDSLRSVFPILLAVNGSSYLNLHDEGESFTVMYQHVLHMRFPNIVAAFTERKLEGFRNTYEPRYVA